MPSMELEEAIFREFRGFCALWAQKGLRLRRRLRRRIVKKTRLQREGSKGSEGCGIALSGDTHEAGITGLSAGQVILPGPRAI